MFFFKQKTLYEMRISDWSSDVCSSDLVVRTSVYVRIARPVHLVHRLQHRRGLLRRGAAVEVHQGLAMYVLLEHREIVAYALDVEGEGGVVTGARRDRCAAECRHAQASSPGRPASQWPRSEEHTSELQSLMRISYA